MTNRYKGTGLEKIATQQDTPVMVRGLRMNVNVKGVSDRKVVILSGRGVTSPADEYAPLSVRLAEMGLEVYTLESFGFGLSDMTDQPRTAENIVAETHEALSQLGVTRYVLVAHSISGLYALQFANTYPDEVEGFVGIDTAFPGMDAYITPELLEETSTTESEQESYDVEAEVADVVGYQFSESQKSRMKFLYERNKTHDDEFETMKPKGERQPKVYDAMKFPDHIPTVFALSSESCGMASWYEGGHSEQLTPASDSRVEILEGQHFLHHQQSGRIAEMVNELFDTRGVSLWDIDNLQLVEVRDGVVLRPLKDGDADKILEILDGDPSIRDRVGVAAKMKSVQDVQKEVVSMRLDDGLIRYVIVENGLVVGLVSLWRDSGYFGQEADPDSYGFGYFLSVEARGRGLVTDSLKALMSIVEKNLKVNSFLAFCEANNQASSAVLEKVGLDPTDTKYTDPKQGWVEQRYEKKL